MSEIALLSSRRSRLEEKAKQGKSGAKIALDLLKHPERFLSTVQIGITVVGVILGAFGGEAFATKLDPLLQTIGVPTTYSYNIAFGVVVTIITYLSIVIGELVPKAIGITYAESITVNLSPLMRFLALVAKPMVFLLTISTKSILKLLGIKDRVEAPVTEEEVKTMIEQGTQHGVFEQEEGDMIKSIFRFGDRKAYAIMTARQEISWLDVNDSLEETRMLIYNSNFTKFPVCDGDLDKIIGEIGRAHV